MVTEGTTTEPQYVEGLNSYLRSTGTTASVQSVAVGKDPLKVVEKCIELRKKASDKDKSYDHCVCLVDVDQHSRLPDAISLAAAESISLLITNLKFEVWLRWHVEDKTSALTTSALDATVKKLGLVLNKRIAPDFPFSGVEEACRTARRVDPLLAAGRMGPDPSSAMPVLIKLMSGN